MSGSKVPIIGPSGKSPKGNPLGHIQAPKIMDRTL